MKQVSKLKRTRKLSPVFQIVQKIPENYYACLYLSVSQVCWLKVVVRKICSKMHSVSCNNTHHDDTDLVNHGMYKNTKTWISWERNITFWRNKRNLNLRLRWNILSGCRFVAEVTFNFVRNILHGFLHCTLSGSPLLWKAPSCVTGTAYQNKTSLPYISPKSENVSFVKFSNYFEIYYLIWNLNTIFVEYLSKNWDMIDPLSRRGCVLYFVNSRLARGLMIIYNA